MHSGKPILKMSLQQVVQPQSAPNGYHRIEKDVWPVLESKLQHGTVKSNRLSSLGEGGGSHDRLVYLATCLIGHTVEVQVLDGSVFSGIFHATDAEKDFGIILKMARLIKDGSRGHKDISGSIVKQLSKTLIIPAKDLVHVIAKGVPVTMNGLTSEFQCERSELLTDSCISQSQYVNVGRELEPWVPGDDDPECPELENVFDGEWDRSWDQFQANKKLFGITTSFKEDYYTTKLEKGPHMKELEREASRIANEIEGEETCDLHLAEERGTKLQDNLEIDEETRYSSVLRKFDDSGIDDTEDILLDSWNYETFGSEHDSTNDNAFVESASWRSTNRAQASATPVDEIHHLQSTTCENLSHSGSGDHITPLLAGQSSTRTSPVPDCRADDNHFAEYAASRYSEGGTGSLMLSKESRSNSEGFQYSHLFQKESSDKGGLSADATAYAPSGNSARQEKASFTRSVTEESVFPKGQGATKSASSQSQSSSGTSCMPDCNGGLSASGPGLSPSSSVGSLSFEKSTLNPNAKEFKLNPNAKSFVPSQSPLRPASPVSDGSFYYPANTVSMGHMPGMPVSVGIVPNYATHSPVVFNPQPTLPGQPYFHPNGPQYGQQMMMSQPRQAFYMPNYPHEMMYKGREF